MHIRTILNRVQKFKGFVYGSERLIEADNRSILEIPIRARRGSRAVCSGCGRKAPGYGILPERRFEFIPFWGLGVHFL
jgi:hypothetical protein